MRFTIIDATKREVRDYEGEDPHDAYASAGLDRGVEHGTIKRGLAIVVYEAALYEDPDKVPYFGIGGQLFSGNAVLYAYDETGETVDLDWRKAGLPVIWFDDREHIEMAIAAKLVNRPVGGINGAVLWRWPDRDRSWIEGAIS